MCALFMKQFAYDFDRFLYNNLNEVELSRNDR